MQRHSGTKWLLALAISAACIFTARAEVPLAPSVATRTHEVAGATSVGPARGTLFVVGGGKTGTLWKDFIELAGGVDAQFVVIPTAGKKVAEDDKIVAALRKAGAKNVTMLHARDREEADSEEFNAKLLKADAVWLRGGRQFRLADAYLGTRAERELHALLARGGLIGGSSAGASIMGSYLVRGSPQTNKVVMAPPGYDKGFAFLRNVAVDQHVNTRKRSEDLRPLLRAQPELLGIGIDESTAVVVRGDTCEVRGPGMVRFLANGDEPAVQLKAGQRYDLAKRREIERVVSAK